MIGPRWRARTSPLRHDFFLKLPRGVYAFGLGGELKAAHRSGSVAAGGRKVVSAGGEAGGYTLMIKPIKQGWHPIKLRSVSLMPVGK